MHGFLVEKPDINSPPPSDVWNHTNPTGWRWSYDITWSTHTYKDLMEKEHLFTMARRPQADGYHNVFFPWVTHTLYSWPLMSQQPGIEHWQQSLYGHRCLVSSRSVAPGPLSGSGRRDEPQQAPASSNVNVLFHSGAPEQCKRFSTFCTMNINGHKVSRCGKPCSTTPQKPRLRYTSQK